MCCERHDAVHKKSHQNGVFTLSENEAESETNSETD